MSSRNRAFAALALGTLAVLGTLTCAYGLVYPSEAQGDKTPIFLAIVGGAIFTLAAVVLGLGAQRRARKESERFFALLAWVVGAYFLFVVALGFGIPALVLGVND
jgi:hypothetical protein